MDKTICGNCSIEMKPKKNGVTVLIINERNDFIVEAINADLWYCPECGNEVIPESKFAQEPFYNSFDSKTSEEQLKRIIEKTKDRNLENFGREYVFEVKV